MPRYWFAFFFFCICILSSAHAYNNTREGGFNRAYLVIKTGDSHFRQYQKTRRILSLVKSLNCYTAGLKLVKNSLNKRYFKKTKKKYINALFLLSKRYMALRFYVKALNAFEGALDMLGSSIFFSPHNSLRSSYKNALFKAVLKEYFKKGLLDKALISLKKSLSILNNEPWVYGNLSYIYILKKDYYKALGFAETSIHKAGSRFDIYQTDKLYENLRASVHNIALKYIKRGDFVKALSFYKFYAKKYADYKILSLIAKLYFLKGNDRQSGYYFKKSRHAYKKIFKNKHPVIRLRFPFKRGTYFCVQGNGGDLSHQGLDYYAWDFARVGRNFSPVKKYPAHQNSDYYSWKDRVYSPVSGRVVKVIGGESDNNGIIKTYTANTVIIREPQGLLVHLVHLKKGSIRVRVGDFIRAGAYLGDCGSSGFSKRPHLHIMVTDKRNVSVKSIFTRLFEYDKRGRRFYFKSESVPVEGNYYRIN